MNIVKYFWNQMLFIFKFKKFIFNCIKPSYCVVEDTEKYKDLHEVTKLTSQY